MCSKGGEGRKGYRLRSLGGGGERLATGITINRQRHCLPTTTTATTTADGWSGYITERKGAKEWLGGGGWKCSNGTVGGIRHEGGEGYISAIFLRDQCVGVEILLHLHDCPGSSRARRCFFSTSRASSTCVQHYNTNKYTRRIYYNHTRTRAHDVRIFFSCARVCYLRNNKRRYRGVENRNKNLFARRLRSCKCRGPRDYPPCTLSRGREGT